MASSYRSIKPAPSRDGAFRKAPQDRVGPKRTGMVKSACWECRKRKAKCNGLKPVCANCAKLETECIYDADVREFKVRNLQNANERLEAELEAAKILLRQVASGSDHIRSLVLGLLGNAKKPLEILHVLKNTEGMDFVIQKVKGSENGGFGTSELEERMLIERAGGSTLPSAPVVPTQASYETSMQPEGLLRDAEYYSISDSITADSAFGHPSMLYAPLYNSSSNDTGDVPGYTASSTEDFNQTTIQQSQVPIPTDAPTYTATLPIHDQRALARQPENRSLFFEPLFNHTDFYLATAAGKPGQSSHSHPSQSIPPQDESFESVSSFDEAKPNDQGPSSMRIHPNVRNHFNNLSLSSSIRVNGYPRHIQDAQIRNIFVPNWAATSLNTVPDPGGLDDAFADIYQQATGLLKDGESTTKIFGHHPNVAALYDQQEFDRSCLLSQWAARMVHSVKRQGYDFTCFASMNVFWYVMRWMIQPSPETYAAMPEWIRPTSNQLFTPHISMTDFVLWPGFRELVVQLPQLQERMAWLADMSMYIKCEWPYPLEQALHRNPISGDVDLVDLAKQHVWTLQCWSVGPSFRRFITNADSYLLIRPDEESANA